ncbi:DUF6998 domain-containing protein [Falsiruegeria mediterranea]|uniref:DUF6998 domain-containing protein n=1 Tax=Falsiruegeria mediterranea M17 TaxID=1200281 RepID=A0A2R8C5M1_9RHOB|nr:hypothetical protein [Falsiruegeria mediterranea]SPJ27717.1 hypothetical protein TRM7615_01208 [Falsiruegeria mediterranea M17]
MSEDVDWTCVAQHLDDLYSASDGLERIFPGRKFTLDGHLLGSIGEVVAAYMFDLDLNPASTLGHDATAADGRNVEIKLTQGKSVAIRHEPEHLIVLQRPKGGPIRTVYNGPGGSAWEAAGKMQKNGQRPISLSRLVKLDATVAEPMRLSMKRQAPV